MTIDGQHLGVMIGRAIGLALKWGPNPPPEGQAEIDALLTEIREQAHFVPCPATHAGVCVLCQGSGLVEKLEE